MLPWFSTILVEAIGQKQEGKTLDLPSVLIFLSCNRNKEKELSTGYIRQTYVTNSRVTGSWDAHIRFWNFNWSNKYETCFVIVFNLFIAVVILNSNKSFLNEWKYLYHIFHEI